MIMSKIYVIVKCISFPGTLMKAFMEHIMCRVYKNPIEDARYMQKNELCGHVDHELFEGTTKNFFFFFVPFLVNFLLGLAFVADSAITLFYYEGYYQIFPAIANIDISDFQSVYLLIEIIFSFIGMWLGVSFLTNLFPMLEDGAALWDSIYADEGSSIAKKVLLAPLAIVAYVGSQMEALGLTFFTSIAIAYAFPYLLLISM